MGGMRFEDVRELPLAYQEQAATQILERLASAAPQVAAEVRKLRVCPECGLPGVWEDPENGLEFCTECGRNRTAKEREDPCIDCLRWWECNGVDEECPLRM